MAADGTTESRFDFLCVDDYLEDMVGAQALRSALTLGLVDRLSVDRSLTLAELASQWRGDRRGLTVLLDLLAAGKVVERCGDAVCLTPAFAAALRFRDLLEAKLDFANLVAPDLIQLFPALLVDPGRFMREARLFELFGYQHCFDPTPENLARARRWMRFTTCLTRYEARVCLGLHDFSRYGTMLDIGGNSGEFVLQACKAHPGLRGVVFDLPVVCAVGREHVAREPEAGRITFVAGNALADPLPSGFDLVCFKSMLHDWPEREATSLLGAACQAVRPGGTLLIFERAPFEVGNRPMAYSIVPMLLFMRSFRAPGFYHDRLQALGFESLDVRPVPLEMPFFLVTGRRGASSVVP